MPFYSMLVRPHLCPDVESLVQQKHRPAGACPEEAHKNDPMNGTPPLQEQAEKVEGIQPEEEKAPRNDSRLSVSKGRL